MSHFGGKARTFRGKSMKLGEGGRAAKLEAQGVPGGVIGDIARAKGAAPGQKNYHRDERKKPRRNGNDSTAKGRAGQRKTRIGY